MDRYRGFDTRLVHSGELKDPRFGNVTTPIFETSTFINPNENPGTYKDKTRNEPYLYTRWGNPTIQALEAKYASVEGTADAMAFSTGMGAISASIFSEVKAGQKILSIGELYGQTYVFFSRFLAKLGIKVDLMPLRKLNSLEFDPSGYDLVYSESITNPTLGVFDIEEVSKYLAEKFVPFFVDATFSTPFNQRPAEYGAAMVIHSGTKYIGGHSDILLGLAGFSEGRSEQMFDSRKNLGSSVDPLQSYLALRGLKTLGLRVRRQNENAMAIAEFLEQNKSVERVYYPGLESSEYHEIAGRVLKGYGGMVSFDVKGGLGEARKFMKNLRVATAAASLGGVETLVTLPLDTTHGSLSPEERKEIGINDSLVRVSVGIEDAEDLISDMETALSSI